MSKLRDPSQKVHNALYFLSGIMTAVLVLVIVVGVQTKAQNAGNRRKDLQAQDSGTEISAGYRQTEETQNQEKWQEGVITYKGKSYCYNNKLRTYLMMGIDRDEPVGEVKNYIDGGQSDAMFLLVADDEEQSLKVISINRNTMTDISMNDENGYDMGKLEGQICLQHAYGDGKKLSCMRSVDVVSDLFGNIPISGYLAMNMGGIPAMNDAIGGVKLKSLQDLSFPEAGVSFHKGKTVKLSGKEAYYYLHGRDTEQFDSATKRLRREEQYIIAYMNQLKERSGGYAGIEDIYQSVSDYLVTSVDFTGLISELANYSFSEDQMYTVPGKTVLGEPIDGERYEEYHVDNEAMQDLIMKIFYVPVQ